VSRNSLAQKADEQPQFQTFQVRARASFATIECTHRISLDPTDEEEAVANEIERQYQGMLAGISRLPRSQRPAARRAAREWRQMMLTALREKRKRDRQARFTFVKSQGPAPR
jgi:recombinational DNA repair ATPase RecF